MPKFSEEYLSRFPSKMRNCLKIESQFEWFVSTIKTDYEPIKVYRLVHNADCINEDDFLDNVRNNEKRGLKPRRENLIINHAVSVNEDKDQMLSTLKFPSKEWKGIAIGQMIDKYGPADFIENATHHNWYLFDGANKDVYKNFVLYEENK